jgi:uncharacterized protein (DUF362 family)
VVDIEDEFADLLAKWRRVHRDDPAGEMRRLLLLAMEREEIVRVGYQETFLTERVARLPVPEDVRELMRQALLWVWRDEEMHATYVRGALLRIGDPVICARAYAQQVGGALGGWAAAVRQHVPRRSAPLSHALAGALTWIGGALGKVPRAVRPYLEGRPFRDFCELNVHAERTAHACWQRTVEIAEAAGCTDEMRAAFEQMALDENAHERAFAVIGSVLGEDDRLSVPDALPRLHAAFEAIGDAFLPRRLRREPTRPGALGVGGRVAVALRREGESPLDIVRRASSDAGLDDVVAARARDLGTDASRLRVVIRPSFMFCCDASDRSTFTDPALVAGLVAVLRERGIEDVSLLECRNIYDRFLARRAVADVAAQLGYDRLGVPIRDASLEQEPHGFSRGMDQATIARSWRDADLRIVFGKLRSHPTELMFGALQAMQSTGQRVEEYLFPERRASHRTTLLSVLDDFPPHFALLDAVEAAADGVAGILGCPHPPRPLRLYAARDALALDLVAAHHAGLADPLASEPLRAACHWWGDPRAQTEVVGRDEPIAGWRAPRGTEWRTLLSLLAWPTYSYGSARGALFLPVVDETAFPHLSKPSRRLRLARRGVHLLLGLRRAR